MNRGHARVAAGIGATVVGFALLSGMLFGNERPMYEVGSRLTVRDTCVALWAFLFPAWSSLEEAWFAPTGNPDALAQFYENQRRARVFWVTVAGAVAIVIGSSAPDLGQQADFQSRQNPPVRPSPVPT